MCNDVLEGGIQTTKIIALKPLCIDYYYEVIIPKI